MQTEKDPLFVKGRKYSLVFSEIDLIFVLCEISFHGAMHQVTAYPTRFLETPECI